MVGPLEMNAPLQTDLHRLGYQERDCKTSHQLSSNIQKMSSVHGLQKLESGFLHFSEETVPYQCPAGDQWIDRTASTSYCYQYFFFRVNHNGVLQASLGTN